MENQRLSRLERRVASLEARLAQLDAPTEHASLPQQQHQLLRSQTLEKRFRRPLNAIALAPPARPDGAPERLAVALADATLHLLGMHGRELATPFQFKTAPTALHFAQQQAGTARLYAAHLSRTNGTLHLSGLLLRPERHSHVNAGRLAPRYRLVRELDVALAWETAIPPWLDGGKISPTRRAAAQSAPARRAAGRRLELVALESVRRAGGASRGGDAASLLAVRSDGLLLVLLGHHSSRRAVPTGVDGVASVAVSHQDVAVASSSRIAVLDTAKFGKPRECDVPEGALISAVAYDPLARKLLYALGTDGTLHVFNVRVPSTRGGSGGREAASKLQCAHLFSESRWRSSVAGRGGAATGSLAAMPGYVLAVASERFLVWNMTTAYRSRAADGVDLVHEGRIADLVPATTRRSTPFVRAQGGTVLFGTSHGSGATLVGYFAPTLIYTPEAQPMWPKILLAVMVTGCTLLYQYLRKSAPAAGKARARREKERRPGARLVDFSESDSEQPRGHHGARALVEGGTLGPQRAASRPRPRDRPLVRGPRGPSETRKWDRADEIYKD